MKKNNLLSSCHTFQSSWILFAALSFFPMSQMLAADTPGNDISDLKLIDQYCDSKGSGIITFDASNIKLFWVSNSVVSEKGQINIFLLNDGPNSSMESPLLPFRLMNVNEAQDCEVTVIAEQSDFGFSVHNEKKQLSQSSEEEDFLHYTVKSATFHLEDTSNLLFYLKFSSSIPQNVSIKKIILSFHRNPSSTFLESPGKLVLSADNITVSGGKIEKSQETNNNQKSFVLTGKQARFFSKQKILVSNADQVVSNSITIKNIGQQPTTVFLAYAPFTHDNKNINKLNNPYMNNTIMKVVSFKENDNRIFVDKMPEWKEKCRLAFNAKEDLSDFPNFNYTDASIVEVKQTDDQKMVEIVFDKPIKKSIPVGTSVRIQSPPGAGYIYTNQKLLQPGEEVTFTSELKYDENLLEFSPKAFSKGVYYVCPGLLSHSADTKEENSILITDFSVSF